MSSTKTQKALETKEITPSSQGGLKEKPTTSKEAPDQQDSKETSKTQPNDLLKKDPINTSTKVNENGENQETKNSKKKTTKNKKEEIKEDGTDQKQEVNEKNAQEGKPNPKEEEEKQGSEPSNKAKKQVADKVQENNIESKENVKNKKEKKVEGSKGLEEKRLEKNETSEKSQPEKTLTIAKPKEKEAKNSTKNEKSKEQNIIRESIQLNSNNPQTDTKPKQSKQVIELKNNKNPQETQPIKDNSTQPDTLTKGNKNNKKPIPSEKPDESEIKLVEQSNKTKANDNKSSGKTLNKKETIDVSKNEDPKSKQEKQKISDEKKGLTPKNQILNDQLKKVETSEGSKTVTNKNAKPSEFSKNSRPISRAEKVENSEYTNSERRGQKNGTEKMRMRSFDAGKTDKISADDSFETRTKMWDIRKKERLLAEEKKRLRKETEECTFSPQLNQKSLSRQLSPGSIYERSVEWSSKVKATLASKGEQILEETRKPEPKKSRVKSAVEHSHSESRPVKRLYNENLVPKCGVIKQNNVLPNNQGPLDIKDNITEQVSEINEMFDVITSAIKQKPLKIYKQPEPPVQKVQKQVNDNRKEPTYSYQSKPLAPKIIQPKNEPQVNRIESLKGILNLKQGDKKEKKQAPKTALQGSENLGVILSQTKDAEALLKKNAQHLEIRNNRYVMVDTNLSPVEKKEEEENNDMSLNLEASETNEIL